ncbi:ribulokinase [Cohnella sp. AR92]|uniref:FGGY-family carbohydrate kinase n=1 Tax=Cohnella sp. AR92 TaxID=648716 RepID=UPI000F8F7011|nr:FGGY family carbohydrate kinase [Cohnella sp. AR92]RUS47089.1 xylulose kinase [Cohnella sp. AR92]
MVRDVLIGIDGGTGSIRVGLYDLNGHPLGFASTDYETKHLHTGWAEQTPEDWWNALKTSMRKALVETGISKERILGISTATTSCSVVLCMSDGAPVRDCLIWMDVRASQEVADIERLTGSKLSAEWMPGKLLWLKRHERENYDKADIFCEYQDWLTYRLTGLWSININNSCNWGYNGREGGFARTLYEKLGMEEAIAKFPSERVFKVGDAIGTIAREAADELGLGYHTLIAQGGIDSSIGVLGMGVYEPGRIALITGSSNLAMALTKDLMFDEGGINSGPDNLIEGYYTAYRGQVSSGSILTWFKREFCKDLEQSGVSVFEALNMEAEGLPIGSEGLVVLDYWQGNRHPYLDSGVRGMFYGLSLHHTRAHMYRALMEGIAYGTENLLAQFRENGFEVGEINIAGGTTNSDLYLQIHADVSNVVVNVPSEPQAPCLGAAICVATAAGVYLDLSDAVQSMVRFDKVIKPIPENHAAYKRIFGQYRKLYPELKDWMRETTGLYLNGQGA